MALPVARTRDEAHLYLDLHPCAKCSSIDMTWDTALVADDGGLARAYFGECPGCQTVREYVFGVPERPFIADFPNFGGPEPSQLLDAGEWLWVSDLSASDMPPDPAEARRALAIATQAVAEVVKFIGAGLDEVTEDAFWTQRGRQLRNAEPGRFRRDRLLILQAAYRQLAAEGLSTPQ